jgi:hypothetical protein
MTVLSTTSKGKVYRTLSKGTTSDLFSAVVTTIIQGGGHIQRHYRAKSTSTVYIDALFDGRTVKVRVSNHSKRGTSIHCPAIKATLTGYRCDVNTWSSLALFRNLIENL